jgi:hypothetical protein
MGEGTSTILNIESNESCKQNNLNKAMNQSIIFRGGAYNIYKLPLDPPIERQSNSLHRVPALLV